jgi:hypothetical protein
MLSEALIGLGVVLGLAVLGLCVALLLGAAVDWATQPPKDTR